MPPRNTRPSTKAVVAEPKAESTTKQGVPKPEVATSLAKRGPILAKWLIMVLALCAEQARIGIRRAANRYSNLEAMVVSKGIAGAEKIRNKGAKKLAKVVEQFGQVHAELNNRRTELDRLPEQPVLGAKGEMLTAKQAEARTEAVKSVVTKETDDGSLKHRRVSRWLARLIPYAAILDLPVLFYFVSEVFNVDWDALGHSVVPLLTSAVFALLGSAAIAVTLHMFGRDLKGYKDHCGHISLPSSKAGWCRSRTCRCRSR